MAKTRRQYSGGAVSTTVASALAASSVSTFVIASSTGWPSSAGVPFYIVVSPQTSSEEKMLVTISGTTLTIVSRGVDGTSASSHASGATVYPVITAIDLDEANELTAKYASRGSIVYQGATTFQELAKGSSGLVLKAGTNDPEWGQVATAGIADDAVTASKIATGSVTSGKIADDTIVDADINSAAAISLSKLATGALPTAITIASANIIDGTIDTADLKDGSVTSAKLAPTSVNSQTGTTYTLVLSDANKTIEMSNASAIALTVPTNSSVAFPTGTNITVIQTGAGQITVSGAGVTFRTAVGLKTRVQWSVLTLYKRDTNEWVVFGDTAP